MPGFTSFSATGFDQSPTSVPHINSLQTRLGQPLSSRRPDPSLSGLASPSSSFRVPRSRTDQDRVAIVAHIPIHLLPPSYANNSERNWAEPADVALLKSLYANWNPTIAAIAERTPAVRVYTDINGPALPSHVFGDGRVVLIGDAGHPHGGAYAAGGTMSVEDAYTLYRALDHAQTAGRRLDRHALRWAFDTFDKARIKHTTRVIDLANETRRKRERNKGVKPSDDVLRASVATRPNVSFLANNDTKATIERTIAENPFDGAKKSAVKA